MTLEEFQFMLGLIEIYVNPQPGDEATTYDQWMREEVDEMDKENILLLANAVKRSETECGGIVERQGPLTIHEKADNLPE